MTSAQSTGSITGRMREAARALLGSLDPDQHSAIRSTLDAPDARVWTYLPGPRPGLSLEQVSTESAGLALALVATASGLDDLTRGAIELERVRRALASGSTPSTDRYWLRVSGSPDDDAWGWRIGGHHLAVHVTVAGSGYTVTPHFLGAEPARVPSGPLQGHRLLAPEEDFARGLLGALDPDRLRAAVVAGVAPADILTRHDPVADASVLPPGLPRADMPAAGQDLLDRLVRRYLSRSPEDYARQCWAEIEQAGLDQVRFAWAGPIDPTRGDHPGHYYCITGPTMIIEYDNTQDGANHAHSVWRHRRDDWGEDLLRTHYRDSHSQKKRGQPPG